MTSQCLFLSISVCGIKKHLSESFTVLIAFLRAQFSSIFWSIYMNKSKLTFLRHCHSFLIQRKLCLPTQTILWLWFKTFNDYYQTNFFPSIWHYAFSFQIDHPAGYLSFHFSFSFRRIIICVKNKIANNSQLWHNL